MVMSAQDPMNIDHNNPEFKHSFIQISRQNQFDLFLSRSLFLVLSHSLSRSLSRSHSLALTTTHTIPLSYILRIVNEFNNQIIMIVHVSANANQFFDVAS